MNSNWKVKSLTKKPTLNNAVLIEGLPGIGNVGKVAVDFLIDELHAIKLFEITSYTFPHSVFVNEENLVELPTISVYYKKFGDKKKQDVLFLAGDVQPIDEESSYEFSDIILDLMEDLTSKEVVTLGGIGLSNVPKKPQVYCTGNTKKVVAKYKAKGVNDEIYGVVGPIVGVSGLLVGLATQRKMAGASLLAETYGHPMYLGIKGAREILKILSTTLSMKININRLDKEIKEIEADVLKKTEQFSEITRQTAIKKLKGKLGHEMDYIG